MIVRFGAGTHTHTHKHKTQQRTLIVCLNECLSDISPWIFVSYTYKLVWHMRLYCVCVSLCVYLKAQWHAQGCGWSGEMVTDKAVRAGRPQFGRLVVQFLASAEYWSVLGQDTEQIWYSEIGRIFAFSVCRCQKKIHSVPEIRSAVKTSLNVLFVRKVDILSLIQKLMPWMATDPSLNPKVSLLTRDLKINFSYK